MLKVHTPIFTTKVIRRGGKEQGIIVRAKLQKLCPKFHKVVGLEGV